MPPSEGEELSARLPEGVGEASHGHSDAYDIVVAVDDEGHECHVYELEVF